ncbi:MAG: trigger factor [Bdellovibrionales bacterium CG10_big_fil_rev_8_21_14_0_10_45_34]|nr:MAG: trigger factor [Bdellovibrionales bacterium CG10_big_fil_rev_8_21_14_0_10_45_34]
MKVDLEKLSGLERKLSFEVPSDSVASAFNQAYQVIQKQVSVKGFRKGKAPIQTLKSMYGDHAKQEALEKLLQKSYVSGLREHDLNPVGYPDIEVLHFQEGEPLKFVAKFEVRPELELQQYENLPLKKQKFELDTKKVDEILEGLRQDRAHLHEVQDREVAQKGDLAVVDFEGSVDGAPLEKGASKDHQLELGAGQFIPGFEDGVMGMKIGEEKTLKLFFPSDYHEESLKGKPVDFKVKLNGLKYKHAPELNDEFAKTFGTDSLEDFRKRIEQDYVERETKRIKDAFKEEILTVLASRNPLEVPRVMLQEQKTLLISDTSERLKREGLGQEQISDYVSKWDEDFGKTAQKMVHVGFLINAIADKENLGATEDDFQKRLEEYQKTTGIELESIRSFYSQSERKDRLMFQITEDKVIDFVASKGAVREE